MRRFKSTISGLMRRLVYRLLDNGRLLAYIESVYGIDMKQLKRLKKDWLYAKQNIRAEHNAQQ